MCVITVKTADQNLFSADYLKEMRFLGHKDGVGTARVVDGRVRVVKILSPTEKELDQIYADECEGYDVAIHMRRQSMGPVTYDNVHPFFILNKEWGDEIDLVMMHNGTIKGIQVEGDRADSYNLAIHFLRPLFQKNPELLDSDEFWWVLAGLIDTSKLVFVDSNNKFTTINSALGRIHDKTGVWVSTTSNIDPKPPIVNNWTKSKGTNSPHTPSNFPQLPSGNGSSSGSSGDNNKIVPLVQGQQMLAGFTTESDGRKHFTYTDVDEKLQQIIDNANGKRHYIDENGLVHGQPIFLACMSDSSKIALAKEASPFYDMMMDFEPEVLDHASIGA